MIYDACLFAGEGAMLELRLRTLAPAVDRFIVVACTRTHQGLMVPADEWARTFSAAVARAGLNFDRAALHWVEPTMTRRRDDRIYEWQPGRTRGEAGTMWYQFFERQHRDGVVDAVGHYGAAPGDLVLVSDVDEIPDVDTLDEGPIRERLGKGWLTCFHRMHSGSLDVLHPAGRSWTGTCIAQVADLAPQAMRDGRGDLIDEGRTIDGPRAVHLSWFGTDREIEWKLRSFSHGEVARAGFDPVAGRRSLTHANGEQLERLTFRQVIDLPWPAPLIGATSEDVPYFEIPREWWSPTPWPDLACAVPGS